MKTIARSASDFADLRTAGGGNCVYVDKTDYFHRLITDPGGRVFFVARPRRFGKSLMITTFKYIFEGRRELLKLAAAQTAERDENWVGDTVRNLRRCEFDDFFARLRSLFAHLPYGAKEGRVHEMSYERSLKILFRSQGLEVVTEDVQSGGRADLVVKYRKAIYVFELKRDESAAAALAQIKEKGYAEPYRADGRPVYLIGLGFDSKTRQLVDAAWERL